MSGSDARKPRRRRWEIQLMGPPRLGYVLGSLIMLCGLGALITSATEGGHPWLIVMGVYFTLWGLMMLLGARAKSRDANSEPGLDQ